VNGALELSFLYQQKGYQEAAEHKKEIYPKVAVLEKERRHPVGVGMDLPDIIKKSKISVV
jgi:hypothetical protein